MESGNCHHIGHTATRSKFPARCPICTGSNPTATNCESKVKRLNCLQVTPLKGSPLCPIYTAHLNALKYSRAHNVSLLEAKHRLSNLRLPYSTSFDLFPHLLPRNLRLNWLNKEKLTTLTLNLEFKFPNFPN